MYVGSFYWIVVKSGFHMSAKSTVNHFSFRFSVSALSKWLYTSTLCWLQIVALRFDWIIEVFTTSSSARVITLRHSLKTAIFLKMQFFNINFLLQCRTDRIDISKEQYCHHVSSFKFCKYI